MAYVLHFASTYALDVGFYSSYVNVPTYVAIVTYVKNFRKFDASALL